MIKSIWENVSRLSANTMLFYLRDLNICEFWYLRGVLELIPLPPFQGLTILAMRGTLLNYLTSKV